MSDRRARPAWRRRPEQPTADHGPLSPEQRRSVVQAVLYRDGRHVSSPASLPPRPSI